MILTVPEAAKAAHVGEKRLRRAINAGDVRALRWSTRRTYVNLRDVTAWVLLLDTHVR